MFFPFQVLKLLFRKALKTSSFTMFSAPTNDKTTLYIYDVFLLSQPQNRAETSVFTTFLQHQKKPA